MTEETIRRYILTEMLNGREVGELAYDQSLLQTGVIDSVGLLHLLTFIEREFQITVEDEELVPENFETIEALGQFVRSKQAAPAA